MLRSARFQRFNTVRNRLLFLFFAITAAAIGFVYLYVVPQLRVEPHRGEALAARGPQHPAERAPAAGSARGAAAAAAHDPAAPGLHRRPTRG